MSGLLFIHYTRHFGNKIKLLSRINNFLTNCNNNNNNEIFSKSFSRVTGRIMSFAKLNKNIGVIDSFRPCSSQESSNFIREKFFLKVADTTKDVFDKVTVVGSGLVGIACVNAILFQRISSHVAIVDAFPKNLEGEGRDFCHGSVFLDNARIEYDTDFSITKNSRVILIAAGVRQKNNESRLDLAHKNVEIIQKIIPPLVANSPDAVFIVVSNPVDILSWATWKIGKLNVNNVIGVGCHLDTARFRFLIAQRLGVAPKSVHGYIVGEHGDSQVPLWSGVNIAGVHFCDILPDIGCDTDEQGWKELMENVIKAGSTVRCLKGYSNTAVGLAAADITKAILRNSQSVKSVSTLVQGYGEICHELFMSLPCTIGNNGITQVIRVRMTDNEKKLLQLSAKILYDIQKTINLT